MCTCVMCVMCVMLKGFITKNLAIDKPWGEIVVSKQYKAFKAKCHVKMLNKYGLKKKVPDLILQMKLQRVIFYCRRKYHIKIGIVLFVLS